MINEKYFGDIKKFVSQFATGIELTKDITLDYKFDKVIVCGMGGSSFYVDLINDILESVGEKGRISVKRGYDLPSWVDKNTLVILSSYSGGTEEALSCYKEAKDRGLHRLLVTAGGELLKFAKENNETYYKIPTGLQPRLSTGYFIAGLVNILTNNGFIKNGKSLVAQLNTLELTVDHDHAKGLATKLRGVVPVVYATDNIGSIARVSKIKFNENSKIQSFYNVIPELNHNEMVGFTKMIMELYFVVFESKFAHERNKKRIEVMGNIMKDKGLKMEVITPKGESIVEEIFNIYHFVDYVTYYLAETYEIDPEPVDMVEDFKKMIG